MPLNPKELEEVAHLLVQGNIGDANSNWNSILLNLSVALQSISKAEQGEYLPVLKQILACQQNADWIGMADGLRHGLKPLVRESP